ncbi:substrate-binding domain-containing protein [Streptomyces tsukubensis]|uniref:LacI family transcriptional regulator n=1 Tax=Streptomyces tsukubensis TaxID=83656 RepID=A0A1V4ABD1_9ACTN|nr:substrate-binding domain-containing protein [Streptomyces tsukubensis]OON80663.1 LacI family transcriptional regulator [Streptomyces tsukubensis]QFR96329.1 DeoR family transcriptional regulator [Streptomyces tsukubensis]
MRFHVSQRRARVLELLRERGQTQVTELAEELGVSVVTLRRDVEALAADGKVERLHGAVLWPGVPEPAVAADDLVIGMVVPTTGYYYADVLRGAREVVEAHGARLTVGLTHYLPGEDATQAERLLAGGAEGLLLTPAWETGAPAAGEGAWIAELGPPTVLVERSAPPGHPAAALDRVRSDHAHGAAEAVSHLAGLGHTKIALAIQTSPTSHALRVGYRAAVDSLGLKDAPPSPLDSAPSHTESDRFDRTLGYLRDAVEKHGVTAALVQSDSDAIVLVPRLLARGIRVPQDLAVVAYDDEVAGLADPPLTAVAPMKRDVGARAAELLLARIAAGRTGAGTTTTTPVAAQHIDVMPELRVRASSGRQVDGRAAQVGEHQ